MKCSIINQLINVSRCDMKSKSYSKITQKLTREHRSLDKQANLLKKMDEMGIAGISSAMIRKEKRIITETLGTSQPLQCGLLKNPKALKFDKSYYIFNDDGFFYYNKSKNKIDKIPLTLTQLADLSLKLFIVEDQIDILTKRELLEISKITEHKHQQPLLPMTTDTIFGAASLSKAIFAYLVLKLIVINKENQDQLKSGKFKKPFTLDTSLCEVYPEFLDKFKDEKNAKLLTARMVLSHTTGLPIVHDDSKGKIDFQFKPGTQYSYSGPGIAYLQEVIEELTGTNLETLAQEQIFLPCYMHQSTFNPLKTFTSVLWTNEEPSLTDLNPNEIKMLDADDHLIAYWFENGKITNRSLAKNLVEDLRQALPLPGESSEDINLLQAITKQYKCHEPTAQAANSLRTTPSDFIKFIWNWMNDKSLQFAFEPKIPLSTAFLPKDWIIEVSDKNEDKQCLAWGLGLGLQLDESENKAVRAYHSGDMDEWRTWVVMNLEEGSKSAVVYFCNSHNGYALAESIISKYIDLKNGFNFFYDFYGFAKNQQELEGRTDLHGLQPSRFLPIREKVEQQSSDNKDELNLSEEKAYQSPTPTSTKPSGC